MLRWWLFLLSLELSMGAAVPLVVLETWWSSLLVVARTVDVDVEPSSDGWRLASAAQVGTGYGIRSTLLVCVLLLFWRVGRGAGGRPPLRPLTSSVLLAMVVKGGRFFSRVALTVPVYVQYTRQFVLVLCVLLYAVQCIMNKVKCIVLAWRVTLPYNCVFV